MPPSSVCGLRPPARILRISLSTNALSSIHLLSSLPAGRLGRSEVAHDEASLRSLPKVRNLLLTSSKNQLKLPSLPTVGTVED